ncbi:two-component sensor histidine kinase [Desulfovibrio oxamicus]|uniref:histidine kinase n=1 Tax=Nitratidesulfovibrio oxamicus TaxID=32016 RepID=A0ABS0J238_9BACT|nr:PAS domain-containing sensor histidine kinase [Nitratidesulfovibrio oxamicus]MBG3876046.1 two-component sensor histidine kinase [Nitratidesulfovibrio oxamicus]
MPDSLFPVGRRVALNRLIYMGILVASVLPLVLILGVMNLHLGVSFREMVFGQAREIADRHSQKIDDFLHERLASVQMLVEAQGAGLLEPANLNRKLEAMRSAYGGVYVDLGMVDDTGIQRVYAGPHRLEGTDYSRENWFLQAGARDVFISDVFMGVRKSPHFIVAVKLMVNGRAWILRSTIDFASFVSLVEDVRVGSTGQACIINRDGAFQTSGGRHSAGDGAQLAEFARRVFGGGIAGMDQDRAFEEGDMVYAMSRLKGGDWILVFQQSSREALQGLHAAQRTLFLVLGLASIAVLVLGMFLAQRIIERIDGLEREMAALNAQVVEAGKLSALGEMAAGIAHEINNPVAIMMEEAGWIEDVLGELQEQDAVREIGDSARQIRTQGVRCRDITHKLLSFARRSDREVHDVDINAMVAEMVELSGQKARTVSVHVVVAMAEGLPPVAASPSELQQVFLNLFNNAFDAMEGSGGTLKVATLMSDTGMVAVNVADTGPGMPEAILQRIYDPFFTTKPVGKGTGLGLSICYGIIHKMGGEIKVSSIVGVGTTFQVLLPPFDPAVHAAPAPQGGVFLAGGGRLTSACPAPSPPRGTPAAPGTTPPGGGSKDT